MKVIGSILIIGSTTLFGLRMAMDLELKYSQLREIQRILYLLQSEISYSRSYLAEAFSKISKQVKEPYAAWLRQMDHRMKKRDKGAFEEIWRETISVYLIDLKIPKKEKERLLELGTCFCGLDVDVQIKSIEIYQEQLGHAMEEMREGMRAKKRLCHCLGVMSGIFLAILLI